MIYELYETCVDELPEVFNISVELGVGLDIIYNKACFNRDEQKHIEYFKVYKNVQVFSVKQKAYPASCLASGAFMNKVQSSHMIL